MSFLSLLFDPRTNSSKILQWTCKIRETSISQTERENVNKRFLEANQRRNNNKKLHIWCFWLLMMEWERENGNGGMERPKYDKTIVLARSCLRGECSEAIAHHDEELYVPWSTHKIAKRTREGKKEWTKDSYESRIRLEERRERCTHEHKLLSQSLIFLLRSFILFLHFFSSREKISKEALFLVESSNYIAFMHTPEKLERRFLRFYYSFFLFCSKTDEAIAQKNTTHHMRYRMDQCSTRNDDDEDHDLIQFDAFFI